jgi:hypothetical protein
MQYRLQPKRYKFWNHLVITVIYKLIALPC